MPKPNGTDDITQTPAVGVEPTPAEPAADPAPAEPAQPADKGAEPAKETNPTQPNQEPKQSLVGGKEDADTKPADGKNKQPSGEGKEPQKQDPKAPKAPETYEDFKMPEGFSLSKEAKTKFTSLAKELDLTQEQAQKLIDLESERMKAVSKQNNDAFISLVDNWRKSSEEALGENMAQQLAFANKAIDKFATPGFKKMLLRPTTNANGELDDNGGMGLGDNIEVINTLIAVGKAISESKFVEGIPGGAEKTLSKGAILHPSVADK